MPRSCSPTASHAAVYAGGVGEHGRLSPEQQVVLLVAVAAAVRGKTENPCLGTGLGRTLERVKQLAPALADLDIAFAMMMPRPPAIRRSSSPISARSWGS